MSQLPNAFPAFKIQTTITTPPVVKPKTFRAKKAGTKGNHIFLILDESGSMMNLKDDTIGGVNSLIAKQIEDKDDTKITIVKFEGGRIKVPVDSVPVTEVGTFTDYSPLGGTNLLDAIGFTMGKVNELLTSTGKKKDRPSIFIQIVTDGYENQSKEFNKADVKNMVDVSEKSDWILTFIGANMDSFAEASSFGFSESNVSNYSTNNTSDAYASISSSLSRMKGLRSLNVAASTIYTSGAVYTAEEKAKMEGK